MYPHDAPLRPLETQTPDLQHYLRLEQATLAPEPRGKPALWTRFVAYLRAPPPPPAIRPSGGYLRRE